ncbi:MAG: hypothetical protein IJR63_08490 [Synergistaceae bacterium]|nr:hypothetical protein [Synergistaceae bacterium]
MYCRLRKFQILVVALSILFAVMIGAFVMMPLTLVLALVSGLLSIIHADFLGDAVHCMLLAMMKGIRKATVKIRALAKEADSLAA